MFELELQQITAGYPGQAILKEISLQVNKGELLALLGPSGEGKTTLLKTIAGLLPPLSGSVIVHGQEVTHLPAEKRRVVLIFQKPLLFPFLDVAANIGFGLRMQGIPQAEQYKRIHSILELTGLEGLERRRPHQLSGGQQQRVALARGLVLRPSVLLLDEPLSNLDADLRQQMRDLIQQIRSTLQITTVFVTHDQSEALMMSDRVALLLGSRIRQIGSPKALFSAPTDMEVARFFGCSNLLQGSISAGVFASGDLRIPCHLPDQDHCTLAIRPERITPVPPSHPGAILAVIESIQFEGALNAAVARVGTTRINLATIQTHLTAGGPVHLFIDPEDLHLLSNIPDHG